MSIELTTQVLSICGISPPEKHILTILCFRANQHHEVFSSIERMANDTGLSIKTIERSLKKLRDNKYLTYTGKIAPKSRNIPIYRINLNHGLSGGDKRLTTDSQYFNHGLSVLLTTPSEGIQKDYIYKDNRKDIDFSFEPSQDQKNLVYSDIKAGFEVRKEMQSIYLWIVENELEKLESIKANR